MDFRAFAELCCFEDLGAVLCEFSCYFLRVGHASALTLRFDFLVPSRDLNSVVNLVYSLELQWIWKALVRLVVVVRAVAWTFRAFARVLSELELFTMIWWFVQWLEPRSICSVASFLI